MGSIDNRVNTKIKNIKEELVNILPHNLVLKNRGLLQISGVVDVENFNEQSITAYTKNEELVISGENLHIGKLNLEQGELCVTGKIDSLEYKEKCKKTLKKESFISKIFK